jgi:raffinose/stachyose/melibiose transport system permease protein
MATKYVVLTTLCIIMMLPVAVAFLGSIRTTGEFQTTPFGLPSEGIQWQNYQNILEEGKFWVAAKNSGLIVLGVTSINVSFATMVAFAFSRIQFRTKRFWFNILSIGLLFPLVVAILPIFIQIRSLGLIGSLWGVILPLAAFGLPGSVVILRGFFINVPRELEEAAYIDGANIYQFFLRIMIPIVRPAIVAVAVLQVITAFNDFFLALVVLTGNTDAWPLTLGLMQFQGQYGTDWASVMAYISILMIPSILFYLLTQKYIVTGLTGGELKG